MTDWQRTFKVGEGSFNLYTNNCEHLARWIRNGKSTSSQVTHSIISRSIIHFQTFSISGFMSGMSGGPDSLIGIITPKLHDLCDHDTNYPPVYLEYENEIILLTIFFILYGFPLLVFVVLLKWSFSSPRHNEYNFHLSHYNRRCLITNANCSQYVLFFPCGFCQYLSLERIHSLLTSNFSASLSRERNSSTVLLLNYYVMIDNK